MKNITKLLIAFSLSFTLFVGAVFAGPCMDTFNVLWQNYHGQWGDAEMYVAQNGVERVYVAAGYASPDNVERDVTFIMGYKSNNVQYTTSKTIKNTRWWAESMDVVNCGSVTEMTIVVNADDVDHGTMAYAQVPH